MRRLVLSILAALTTVAGTALPADANPSPPFIPADADWLTTVNYYRAMAGLGSVTANAEWSAGAYNHSCYMLYNTIAHDEVPGNPGYTPEGDAAGNAGNVAVSSAFGVSARTHIELWMTGPFHAIGVLRHNLAQVGFGKCDSNATSPWKSGATLDVLRGLTYTPRPSTPILFPGNGTTTSLDAFVTEYPDPTSFCGWTGGAGLPVIAMMPEAVGAVSGSISGPNGPLETCTLSAGNTNGIAQSILNGDNAVIVMPRRKLEPGTYTVNVNTQARAVSWSFTVDPAAKLGAQPLPNVAPSGSPTAFEPTAPSRFADSRDSLRITRLRAGAPKRIVVAGTPGIPADAKSVSANLTAVGATGGGYLTAYNCSAAAPTAASLNYQGGEATGNAGLYPLNASGELCVIASTDVDLVIDINGYTRPSGTGRLTTLQPTRVVDTTVGMGIGGRLGAGVPASFSTRGFAPAGTTSVVLNATVSGSWLNGYVTFYPCGSNVPIVAGVNQIAGIRRSNQVVVPVAADGSVCLVSSTDVDLQVDALGYVGGSGSVYTPTAPTRLMDTRDALRPELNAGTGGQRIAAGQVVTVTYGGLRGIPTNASALALNVAVVGSLDHGTLTVWPCGAAPATTSTSFKPSVATNNGIQAKLSAGGQLCLRSTVSAHVVIDINGWWN
jgi:hypothetical protein